MGKNRAKRKALAISQDVLSSKKLKQMTSITPPPDPNLDEPKTFHSLGLASDDIEAAIDTLATLSASPAVIKSKTCRDLRTAVYDFRLACTTGSNAAVASNLTSRISGALADGKHTEARVLLAEMRIRGQKPKLGALCRWVRDLDVVSGLAEQVENFGDTEYRRSLKEIDSLMVLDAILRATGPIDYTMDGTILESPIIPRKHWEIRQNTNREMVYESVLDRTIFETHSSPYKSLFRVIETTPGMLRTPANKHPAILYTSKDDAIALLDGDLHESVTYHSHPTVPNLYLFENVLRPSECREIICAAETIGFTPDAPLRAEGEESSVLAHNFYWIVDCSFCSKLWNRVKRLVPAFVDGKKVRGLNRRFRVYRYVPGAEYRAHIDGAWPPSGIDSKNNAYIYDNSPPDAKQSSLFTFLIYLNDEFEGGETTFFLPGVKEGSMNAYPIKPIQGSVAMFPHGETDGSLLHEGTGVRQGKKPSAKYVIRTDVLYDVDPTQS